MRYFAIRAFVAVLCCLAWSGLAHAQARIDQLGAGVAVQSTDSIPNCQGCGAATAAVKTTYAQMVTFFNANLAFVTGTSLTSGKIVTGNGSSAIAVDANAGLSAGALTLGASGTQGSIAMGNTTTGTLTLTPPATGALGTSTITFPIGTTDFSATGGTNQILKQLGVGNPFTVGAINCAFLSDSTTACSTALGTSGATIPLLSTANTWTLAQTFTAGATMNGTLALGTQTVSGNFTATGVPILSGLSAGTQVSILGLDAGNHVVTGSLAGATGFGVDGGTNVQTITGSATVNNNAEQVILGSGWVTGAATLPAISAIPSPTTGCIRFHDSGAVVDGTHTFTITANAADKINNGSAGGSIGPFNQAISPSVLLCVSGTHNWNVAGGATVANVAANGVLSGLSAVGAWTQVTTSTANQVLVSGSSTSPSWNANATINAGALQLGASSTPGSVTMGNATSGLLTLAPSSGALGTITATFPINTGTVAELNLPQNWTAAQTFAEVLGTVTTQSGTTYTLAAADCGTEVTFSNASAVTVTIPATLPVGCNIAILQTGAGAVSVNGSAVAAATLHSAHSYTKTSAQWAVIGINIEANAGGSSAIAILTGDGA